MKHSTVLLPIAPVRATIRGLVITALVALVAACATPSSTPRPESGPEPAPEPRAEAAPAADPKNRDKDTKLAMTSEPAPEPESEPPAPAATSPDLATDSSANKASARAEAQSRTEPTDEPDSHPAAPEPELASQPQAATPTVETDTGINRRITGQIELLRNGREQRFPATYLEQTVVAWRPEAVNEVAAMEERQIVTRSSRFYPQVLTVTSGTKVRFPNLDEIRHNVFSITPGHRFDVGVYGPDKGVATIFEGVGTVDIFCNIHPNMAAFLLVLDTAHFTTPDEDGRFELQSLPPGPGELLVWNYRSEQRITRRSLADSNRLGEEIEVTIDITRPSVPQHTTKEGRPYYRPGN